MKETTENTTTEENRDAENRVQRFVPLYDFGVCKAIYCRDVWYFVGFANALLLHPCQMLCKPW